MTGTPWPELNGLGSPSFWSPMRMLFRFRVRTLLLAVAASAVLLTAGPRLWWRFQVNSALERTVATGPDVYRGFKPSSSGRSDDRAYLLSDYERVANRLLEIAQSNDDLRRANAIKTLRVLSARSGSFDIRKKLLPQLIDLACTEQTPSPLATLIAENIADWIPSTGATMKERGRIRAAAVAASGYERVAWIAVLESIGGRDETVLLLQFADTLDENQFSAIYNSQFRKIIWSGMLPHVQRWILDPTIADGALEFDVLAQTPTGRNVLVEFSLDATHPRQLRRKAVEQLVQTVGGINQLTDACTDPTSLQTLSELLGTDSKQFLTSERAKIIDQNGPELWSELINGLDPSYFLPGLGAQAEPQVVAIRQRSSQLSLDSLRILSQNRDLTTSQEWRAWYEKESPSVVMLRDILSAIVDHPDLIENIALLRRIVPYQLGYIPDDCIPIYEFMLESKKPQVRYWACQALLAFTDSPPAVDVAIGLIDQSEPSEAASVHPGAIAMIQRRFAVNFFWDTAAWRRWASDKSVAAREEHRDNE